MMFVVPLGMVLLLCGIVWFVGYDWKHWFLPSVSRRILGAVLCSAWALLLATRHLAAAILASGLNRSYSNSLELLGPLLPILAWVSLALGIWLLGERRPPPQVVAASSEDPPTTGPS